MICDGFLCLSHDTTNGDRSPRLRTLYSFSFSFLPVHASHLHLSEPLCIPPPTMTSPKPTAPYSHDEVHLIPATSQAIIQQTWTNNKEEWGKTLDLETYYAREVVLATQKFTKNNKLQVWVLVPKTFDPENPDLSLILSAVETFLRPGVVATKELGVRDVTSVSVASVFTPARYRGHGYGSLMMR